MRKTLITLCCLLTLPCFAAIERDSIGIFYQDEDCLKEILPIRYSKTKTNTLGSALTWGIAGSNIKKVYQGNISRNIIDNNPTFYFYYQEEVPFAKRNKYYMFYASDTPDDILLAKFKQKRKTRELTVGKVNIYSGMTIGTTDDLEINVLYEEVREGVFKVSFDDYLDPGEYCFLLNEPDGTGAYMYVFDLSVGGKDGVKLKEKEMKKKEMYF